MFATLKVFINGHLHISFLLHNAMLHWLNLASLTSRVIVLANILSYTLTFLTVINILFFSVVKGCIVTFRKLHSGGLERRDSLAQRTSSKQVKF